VPALIVGLVGIHLAILVRQKHTQFAGGQATERNVVGSRLWPTFAAKTLGLFFVVFAVLAALGGLAQINPVWLWGPFHPATVSSGSQPDWYIGWLEGALRLMPAWETRVLGFEIPNPFYPGVLIPGIFFSLLYAWPFLEARVTGDHDEHHLLDRPRDRPVRTAIGVAALTFFFVLFVAGGNDVLAAHFGVSVNSITWALRFGLFVLPALTGVFAWRLAHELSAQRPGPAPPPRPAPAVVLRRTRTGGYEEDEVGPGTAGPEASPPS